MQLSKRWNDWDVLGVAGVGGGVGGAAGVFTFHFRDPGGDVAVMKLTAAGIGGGGFGGSVGGSYSRIYPGVSFSINDLTGAAGTIFSASAGFIVAWSVTTIGAVSNNRGGLFDGQSVGGLTASAGAGLVKLYGSWTHHGTY